MNAELAEEDMAGEARASVRKERSGCVVSDAMDKTIVVMIEIKRAHPLYGKRVKKRSKIFVHDEKNEAKVGDIVRVEETRPLSLKKRWRLVGIESRAETDE